MKQIQNEFQNLVNSQAPETSYSKKLESENVKSILKLIQSKQNQLSKVRFEFIGEPQPPSHISVPQHDSKVFSNLNSNSISVTDQDFKLTSDHIYIVEFSNSIVSLESQSMNLQNGQDCICNLHSAGPIFIHDAINCVFILSCHQVRLHQIRDSIVIVNNREKGNPIIIENCSSLHINDVDVDDFNHPSKSTKSPNYDILPGDKVKQIQEQVQDTNLCDVKPCVRRLIQLS